MTTKTPDHHRISIWAKGLGWIPVATCETLREADRLAAEWRDKPEDAVPAIPPRHTRIEWVTDGKAFKISGRN